MNRIYSHLDQVDFIGKLADLKAEHYHSALLINAIIELLVEKGVVTRHEIERKAAELDAYPMLSPRPQHPIS